MAEVKHNKGKLITEFNKNSTEVVRIQLTEYDSRQFLDIRIWVLKQDGEYVPTKKGITIRVDQVDSLKEAIDKAQEEMERTQAA